MHAWWEAAPLVLRYATLLWLVSAVTGATAASVGQWSSVVASSRQGGLEPSVEPILIGFWLVLLLVVWGGRAVAAVVVLAARSVLARAFLLLLGPFAALFNDIAAVVQTRAAPTATTLAVVDLALVVAATVLMYRPPARAFLNEVLAARGAAMRAHTASPPPADQPAPTTSAHGMPTAVPWPASTPDDQHGRRAGWGWRPTNTLAILALVMAFVFPLLGPVFGIAARDQIAHSEEEGSGLALSGILIGLGWVLLFVVLFGAVALLGPDTSF